MFHRLCARSCVLAASRPTAPAEPRTLSGGGGVLRLRDEEPVVVDAVDARLDGVEVMLRASRDGRLGVYRVWARGTTRLGLQQQQTPLTMCGVEGRASVSGPGYCIANPCWRPSWCLMAAAFRPLSPAQNSKDVAPSCVSGPAHWPRTAQDEVTFDSLADPCWPGTWDTWTRQRGAESHVIAR
ncbi:hypothetical protein PHYPSEUDO_012369 [Phytophthora pseudosyringae]|uniref:Uncharacterized protein n=1 Tax=Phytophthora pseudosyringae TaxID=221518 RepID=A0A8T1VA49_9STRA|nr:hypothetical protein PHYPSEUDO_012369 [Phytophthora pseudosyringae]